MRTTAFSSQPRTCLVLPCCLLGGVSSLSGREAVPRTCRILFLEGPDSAPRTLDLFDGSRSQEPVYPICETQWLHDPRSRSLAFIFAKPGVRTPRVLVFPDYRQTDPQDASQ